MMHATDYPELKRQVESSRKEELAAFVARHRIAHRISMFSVTQFALFLLYYAAGLVVKYFTTWDSPFHTMDTETGAIIFTAFLLVALIVFLGCRSYLETYSSFQRYLRHKKSFFLRAKKQIDKSVPSPR